MINKAAIRVTDKGRFIGARITKISQANNESSKNSDKSLVIPLANVFLHLYLQHNNVLRD
jgi:hypothetical protein